MNSAFCPHLGAHFGFGGSVVDDRLACPFHGWRFNGDGENTLIPYADRTNKKACLRTYPTVERNGLIMAWYHPDEAAPDVGGRGGRGVQRPGALHRDDDA